jgi:hypothetical protein
MLLRQRSKPWHFNCFAKFPSENSSPSKGAKVWLKLRLMF